jgi:hypothetical protein
MIWIVGIAITLGAATACVKKIADPDSGELHVRFIFYAAADVALAVWAMFQIPAMARGTWHAPRWYRLWGQASDTTHIVTHHVILVILVAVALAAGLAIGLYLGIRERDWDMLRTTFGLLVVAVLAGTFLQWAVGFFDPLVNILDWLFS